MTIIQKPSSMEVALNMPDFIIDTDSTINFSVKYNGKTILSENYVPDSSWQVRTHKLGKFLANALWGVWGDGNVSFEQANVMGEFGFYVNDVLQCTSSVLYSRQILPVVTNTAILSRAASKVVRPGDVQFLSVLVPGGHTVYAEVVDDNGERKSTLLFVNEEQNRVVITFDTSYSRIASLLPSVAHYYDIRCGSSNFRYLVDSTPYVEIRQFRFKNVYDCPEYISCVGELSIKGNDKSSTGFMYGVERKFDTVPNDEYTCRSGVLFRGEEYKSWHDFLNTREAQILVDGVWYPIIITKQNYERVIRRDQLREVEFSFRFADPDQNGLL